MTDGSQHVRGTVLVAAGVLCLVPDSTLVRLVDAGSLTTAAWRGLLVAVAILGGLAVRYRSGFARAVTGIGTAGAVSSVMWAATSLLFVASVDRTSIANTLVLISSSPFLTAVLTRVVLREAVPRRTWLAIPFGMVGVVITVSGSLGSTDLDGDLLALLLAVVVAANLTLLRSRRHVDMVPAGAIGGVLTFVALTVSGVSLSLATDDVVPMVLMGGLFVPAALALITTGTRHLASAEVSLLLLLETALGPLLAWVVVDEPVGAATLAGGAILVATLVTHSALGLRAARTATRPPVAVARAVS